MAQQMHNVRASGDRLSGERPIADRADHSRLVAFISSAKSVGVVAIAAAMVGGLSTPAAALEQEGSAREQALELAAIAQTMEASNGASSGVIARVGVSGTTAEELADIRAAEQAAREAAAEAERAADAGAAQSNTSGATTAIGQASVPNAAGNGSIVSVAQSQLGVPYVFGGMSPSTGFDCSGFTMWVYSQFGYSLPRLAGAQASAGTPVPASSVAPGDLVVWPGHVAIYVGGDRIIHSPTAGSTVKYSQYSAMVGAFGTPQVRRFG